MRLGKLLGELLFGQRRRLFLQLHVEDLRARGLLLLLGGKARLLRAAQLRPQRLQLVARRGQRLFRLAARSQLRLQCRLDRRPVDGGALAAQLREQRALLLALRDDPFATPFELGQPIAAAALRETCFLRGKLGDPHPLATAGERRFRLVAPVPRGFARGELVVQPRLQIGNLRHDGVALPPAGFVLGRDVGRFLRDLRAPLLRGFGGLPQLQELELEIVDPTLLRADREAFRVIRVLRHLQFGVDRVALRARFGGRRTRGGHRAVELFELPLPGDDAVQLVVRCEERHALRGDEVPGGRHERLAGGQRVAVRQRRREIGATANAVQPIGDEASDVRLLQAHLRQQRLVLRVRRMAGGRGRIGGDAARRLRAVGHPARSLRRDARARWRSSARATRLRAHPPSPLRCRAAATAGARG